jgi:dATP pyrophosphohydrolase
MCYRPSIAVGKEFLENDIVVIPEYSFAVEVRNERIKISSEHTRFEWLSFQEACNQLYWDSNKTALWELDYKLKNNLIHKEISC